MGHRSTSPVAGLGPAAISLAAVLVWLVAPVLGAPGTRALGRACSEAPAHLWGLWVASAGLAEHGPLVRDAAVGFPGHFRHHLIDPVNLLVMWPAVGMVDGATGAVLGWNLLHVVAVLVGGVGAMVFGRRLSLSGWPLAVLVACTAGSAAMFQHVALGRTEYLPVMGLPWVLAGMWDVCRGGPLWKGLLAGGLLGAMVLSGPTLALFLAPVVAVVGLYWSRHLPRRRRPVALGSVVVPGLLGAVVGAVAMVRWPPPHDVALLAGHGRELVNSAELGALLRLASGTRELETTLYLGVVALPLAVVGLVRARSEAAVWASLCVLLVLVGVGPFPTLFGAPLMGPVAPVVDVVGVLGAVSGWPRAAWVLALPLGVCAALGVRALGRPARWLGPVLVVALLVDHATWPADKPGEAWFAAEVPADVAAVVTALPDGPLFTLPASTPAHGQACAMDAPWLLWGQALGRPVTANQGKPTDGLADSDGLASALVREPARVATRWAHQPVGVGCAVTTVQQLSEAGISAVVVAGSLPRGTETRAAAEALFGTPHVVSGDVVGWSVDRWLQASTASPEPCAASRTVRRR